MKKLLIPLIVVFTLLGAAAAQAHTVNLTAVCGQATITWSAFTPAGPGHEGNGGFNTPTWSLTFTPATGAAPITLTGQARFNTAGTTINVALPTVDGTLTGTSSWTSAQTTDGFSASYSTTAPLKVTGSCAPSLATKAASAPSSAPASLTDVATLANGFRPTGTITWSLYGPNDNACTGTPQTTAPVTVNGNGSYTSPSITVTQAGTYHWVATYSGDGYNPEVVGLCSDANESVTATTTTTTSSTTSSTTSTTSTTPTTTTTTSTPTTTTTSTPTVTPSVSTTTSATTTVTGTSGVAPFVACVASKVTLTTKSVKHNVHFTAVVHGANIKSVVFAIDGKTVKTVKKANDGADNYSYTVAVSKGRYGAHKLTAKITTNCGTKTGTLDYSRNIPARTVVPKFTG